MNVFSGSVCVNDHLCLLSGYYISINMYICSFILRVLYYLLSYTTRLACVTAAEDEKERERKGESTAEKEIKRERDINLVRGGLMLWS